MSDKLCKDCRHNSSLVDYCTAPQLFERVPKFDLVRGARHVEERRAVSPSCYVLRYDENECGFEGKWFEERPHKPGSIVLIDVPKPWWRFWE